MFVYESVSLSVNSHERTAHVRTHSVHAAARKSKENIQTPPTTLDPSTGSTINLRSGAAVASFLYHKLNLPIAASAIGCPWRHARSLAQMCVSSKVRVVLALLTTALVQEHSHRPIPVCDVSCIR